jgi:phosphate transport system protein
MEELRTRYHRQLEEVEGQVIHLFALVSEGLAAATEALLDGDPNTANVLAERESEIGDLYQHVETVAYQQFALQGPIASELRFLLSVLRIAPELERAHALALHIARRANPDLQVQLTPRMRGLIELMGRVASEMWRVAADGWYERNAGVAEDLEERDDDLDALRAALMDELGRSNLALPAAIEMGLIARFYERLGDHALSVSERIAYLAGVRASSGPAGR